MTRKKIQADWPRQNAIWIADDTKVTHGIIIDLIQHFRTQKISYASTLGFVAAVLTTVAFVPQVVRIWRSRSARDISLSMYALFTLGVLLWLIYGILIVSWPVIIGNGITLVLALSVLVMKVKFG